MSNCAVYGCNTSHRNKKGKGIHLYSFPKVDEYRKAWINACKRADPINADNARICSLHFTQDSYHRPLIHTLLNYRPHRFRGLKPDAIPTVNLPQIHKSDSNSECVEKPEKILKISPKYQEISTPISFTQTSVKIEKDVISSYSDIEDDCPNIIDSVIIEIRDGGRRFMDATDVAQSGAANYYTTGVAQNGVANYYTTGVTQNGVASYVTDVTQNLVPTCNTNVTQNVVACPMDLAQNVVACTMDATQSGVVNCTTAVTQNELASYATDITHETYLAEDTQDATFVNGQTSIEKTLTSLEARWKTQVGMLCRLCTKSDFNCIPIFRGKGEKLELGTKIMKYLHVEVQPDDKLPDQVCTMCLDAVCAWDEFAESVVTAGKKLRELILDEDEARPLRKEISLNRKPTACPEQKILIVSNQNLIAAKQNLATLNQNLVVTNENWTTTNENVTVINKNLDINKQNTAVKQASESNTKKKKFRDTLDNSAPVTVRQNENCGTETEECSYIDAGGLFNAGANSNEGNIEKINVNNKKSDNVFKEINKEITKVVYRCGICSTLFFSYLQCAAHKMAAHPKRTKVTAVEESDLSGSEAEDSHSVHDVNDSVNKDSHEENAASLLEQNTNKENCYPERRAKFKCSVCSTNFLSFISLAAHKMAAHASHKCVYCFQTFPTSKALRRHNIIKHVSISEKEEPKTCPVCNRQMPTFLFKKHLRSHPGLCVKCFKTFPDEKEFEEHKIVHLKDCLCHTCGKKFSTNTNLKCHLETHLPDSVAKRFKCPKCDAAFRMKQSVKRHLIVRHSSMKVLCQICSKTFTCPQYLLIHMRQMHSSASPVQCEVCGKVFKLKKYLVRHMLCHSSTKRPANHKNKQYDVKCEKCGRFFASRTGLTLHSRNDCTSNSRMCYICGLILETSLEFQKHLIKHKSKRYQCNYCDRSFSSVTERNTHTYKHTGERPYPCVVCDKRFVSKYTLLLHSSMHTNSKPFKCQFCDKAFRCKKNLVLHIRIHTNDKRYKCDICDVAFVQSGDLKRHKQRHYRTLPCIDKSNEG